MDKSPYRFLDFYTTDDSENFFGRERETKILVADILVSRLVILFARTGTGKTSLINAGVRPILRSRGFETYYIRVEKDPTQAALDVLNKDPLLDGKITGDSLADQLLSVVRVGKQPIVLFFDQFEEFFLQIKDRVARQKFVAEIAKTYENVNSGVHIVFSMREEYYYRMDEFRTEIPSIFHQNSNLRLLPLDDNQARDAIIKPAAAQGVTFDEDLAEEIIRELKSDRDGIRAPRLQIICDTLWRREDPADRHITIHDYKGLGGGQGILDKRLAQDIEQTVKDKELLAIMELLIFELQTDKGTKYPRLFSELVGTLQSKLNTNEKTLIITEEKLRQLTAQLKSLQLIKEMTISGADAIEWASDYLAEQSQLLVDIVRSSALKILLWEAINKATSDQKVSDGEQVQKDTGDSQPSENTLLKLWPFLREYQLIQFTENINSFRSLQSNEIEFLFDVALFYQHEMKLWYDQLPKPSETDLTLLRIRIQNKETNTILREGVIVLLREIGSSEALKLLEETMEISELADKAIDAIIRFPNDDARQLLRSSLERDDLWESVVRGFDRAPATEDTVALLSPLLLIDTKVFQVLPVIERIAKANIPVKTNAIKSLETVIPTLNTLLQQDDKFFQAVGALERLMQFTSTPVADMAEESLEAAIPRLNRSLQQESKLFDALSVLERLSKYPSSPVGKLAEDSLEMAVPILAKTLNREDKFDRALKALERLSKPANQAGSKAKKALESALPILEKKLKQESSKEYAQEALGRLAKLDEPIGSMANKILTTSESAPKDSQEISKTASGNRTRMAEIAERLAKIDREQPIDIWNTLLANISKGVVIPVISNSFRMEQIFQELVEVDGRSVIDGLIAQWARMINYPMPDSSNLAQVAQYYFLARNDDPSARTEFFSFLKKFLWNMANTELEDPALAAGLQSHIEEMRFSDLVKELDYPRFPPGTEDPLRLLARFPLPVYITTSQSDFLERALEAEGKRPHTQICFWSGEMTNIRREHRTIAEEINMSVGNPLVYHLYGLEEYPQTLVLSEDDYINFLISITEDTNNRNPMIPLYLRNAIAGSQLLLIGFRLFDWDFRVLFRLMMNFRIDRFSPRGILIQPLEGENQSSNVNAIEYLHRYFGRKSFDLEWNNADRFVHELWSKWDTHRQDQS
jgi:hypothetical protein